MKIDMLDRTYEVMRERGCTFRDARRILGLRGAENRRRKRAAETAARDREQRMGLHD